MADPYKALGIEKGASEKEIKSAYRKLAKELHPDRNKDNPRAAARFSDVTKAYDLLTDTQKRGQYDRGEIDAEGNPTSPFGGGFGGGGFGGGHPGGAGGQFDFGGADLGDILGGMFGEGQAGGQRGGGSPFGRQAPPQKGGDIAYRLRVDFVAAARLEAQRITLEDGKTIDVKMPKGLENGTQMRLGGKGRKGPGGAGDAIITLDIKPHPFFVRDGDNVLLDLPISLKEAVEGAKVKVPTVDGAVMLSVPVRAGPGKTLRLKNKGFHNKAGIRGDQLVKLIIALPENDAELQDFVARWENDENPRAALGV